MENIEEALMDIWVGGVEPGTRTGSSLDPASSPGGFVEAQVLAVRSPRGGKSRPDPPAGQVLVLMIPDGKRVPADLGSGSYRVLLRFARR
jgi:hypothetical protein